MLTWDEKDYLRKIPDKKKVSIKPYNKRVSNVASLIIKKVNEVLPHLEIKHIGASALEISGQNDIDIYILSKPNEFDKYTPILEKLFGKPQNRKYDSISWKLDKEGFDIELYLTNPASKPMKRQLAIYKTLKQDKRLLNEYEKLKKELNGKSFREYQKKKYEFYHRILDAKR